MISPQQIREKAKDYRAKAEKHREQAAKLDASAEAILSLLGDSERTDPSDQQQPILRLNRTRVPKGTWSLLITQALQESPSGGLSKHQLVLDVIKLRPGSKEKNIQFAISTAIQKGELVMHSNGKHLCLPEKVDSGAVDGRS